MDKNGILLSIVTLLVGFIGGFLLANSINRSELNSVRLQTPPAPAANSSTANNDDLTPEELRAKVAEADSNPTNFQFQKDLGIGLYRYGAMKQDVAVLTDAARILARAESISGSDADVLTNLGNAYFDIGFAKKDGASYEKARDVYKKAMAITPNDAEVQTDLGISYYVQPQPDYEKAAAALKKVIEANPRHDRSMQFLAQVYIEQRKFPDAERLIAKLKEIAPTNESIPKLTGQIERAKARAE